MILEFRIKTESHITPDEMESIKDWIWDSLDDNPGIEIDINEITYEIKP